MRMCDAGRFGMRSFSLKLTLAEWHILVRKPPPIPIGVLDKRHQQAYEKYVSARDKALKKWLKEAEKEVPE